MLRFSLIPREVKFFDLFDEMVAHLTTAARHLADLFENYQDVEAKVAQMKDLEHQADAITHRIIEQLHLTFVTPLDREDIALLAHSLDDVMDFMDGVAGAMVVYHIPEPTPRARELASILITVTDELSKAVPILRHRRQLKSILEHCVEINRLENQADDVLRRALSELFDDALSVVDIIKWREIYEQLESATDRAEDVADVLEGVVLKYG